MLRNRPTSHSYALITVQPQWMDEMIFLFVFSVCSVAQDVRCKNFKRIVER